MTALDADTIKAAQDALYRKGYPTSAAAVEAALVAARHTLADVWDHGWQDCFAYYASAEVGVQLTAEGKTPPHLPHPANPYRRTDA